MPATPDIATAQVRPSRSTLAAALLGQPDTDGAGVALLQVFLILLWHAVLFVGVQLVEGGLGNMLPPQPEDALAIMVVLASIPGVEGILAFILYRAVTRRERFSLAHFTRLWWRTCLWGLLAFPIGAALVRYDVFAVWAILLTVYLLAGPAWLARRERRGPRVRRARWQPVCPECGYSLRRLTSDRCPECGEAFPTSSRVYRRWANRRLPWERRVRGGVATAYLRTILLIIFRPGRAARGVAIPDRYGQAVRWAALHLVVLALLGTGCLSQSYFRDTLITRLAKTDPFFATVGPSPGDLLIWIAQSFALWSLGAGLVPLLGAVLGFAVLGRHPAARRGIVKWSLYSFGGISVALGVTILVGFVSMTLWILADIGVMKVSLGSWYRLLVYPAWLPPWTVVWATLYGCWWATGVAANPYVRRRGLAVFLANALLYVAVWLAFTRILFNPGVLRTFQ